MSTTEAFSKSIDSYLNYTRMPWGRLFYETAWQQINPFMGEKESVLDIGCGFGITANEYARLGHKVTALEPTPEMIALARMEGPEVRYICDSFQNAAGRLEEHDWIFCHNILEYVEEPGEFIQQMGACQSSGGYLSLIAHNPAAKVMKKAIIQTDPENALAAIGSNKEYSGIIGTDIAIYSLDELTAMLQAAGYEIAARFGIHNLYGYIADNAIKQDGTWHRKMTEFELTVGGDSPYRDIAIFTHIIARKLSV